MGKTSINENVITEKKLKTLLQTEKLVKMSHFLICFTVFKSRLLQMRQNVGTGYEPDYETALKYQIMEYNQILNIFYLAQKEKLISYCDREPNETVLCRVFEEIRKVKSKSRYRALLDAVEGNLFSVIWLKI